MRDTEALERDFVVHRYWQVPDKPALLKSIAGEVRAIATRGDLGVSAEVMNALPKLEIISCFGVGVDAIDLNAAKAKKVHVTNTPDVLTEDVADLAFALMLGIARQIPQADRFTRLGHWTKGTFQLLNRVNHKRLGIVGLGRIGLAIAKRAEGFSMEISYCTRTRRTDVPYQHYATPAELAAQCDYMIAILPGGAATQNVIDGKVFEALGPKGFFINVARGSVVDEEALLQALEQRKIAGAALDVYWNEPNINPRFLALNNVVLHPHGGSGTVETRQAMGQLVRDNLSAHFAGRPLLTPVV